jgi:hypothetical protein
MMEAGARVGALLNATDTEINFLGFGVYEGDFALDDTAVGWMVPALKASGRTNPRIRLDSGKVVWGCECWWGPEEKVAAMLASTVKRQVLVDIDEARRATREQAT